MRIGIVGLGHAGFDIHLPALAGIRSAVVVGTCDADASRRAGAMARWGVPAFEDFDAMLDRTRPEAVIVATPPASHAELCMRALTAGAHVICEKPFVSSLREADRVLAAAQTAGRQVVVNHEFREMPIFRTLIEQAGLKGTRVGACEVSDRHANFIVTHEGATAGDVLRLIDLIRMKVSETHAIDLELEIQVW